MNRETKTALEHDQLLLALHAEQAVYSIGEPIRLKLQISNNTGRRTVTGQGFVFNWEQLAFAEPNAVHLIGPCGIDLALPYRREQSSAASLKPIVVDAGREEWLYLPIHAFFRLRELGEYAFWLELTDDRGVVHRSNRISFQLVDVEASVAAGQVELTLQSGQSSVAASHLPPIGMEAAFTSKHLEPLIFLKPQEDSLFGWVNPVCRFTVVDGSGRVLAQPPRSGTMAIPAYNGSTQFVVPPGETRRQQLQLPGFDELRHPGKYRVRLTYIVRRNAIGKDGVVLEEPENWDKQVFVGRLESNEVTITTS
jgi:hypothetical protein